MGTTMVSVVRCNDTAYRIELICRRTKEKFIGPSRASMDEAKQLAGWIFGPLKWNAGANCGQPRPDDLQFAELSRIG